MLGMAQIVWGTLTQHARLRQVKTNVGGGARLKKPRTKVRG